MTRTELGRLLVLMLGLTALGACQQDADPGGEIAETEQAPAASVSASAW